MYASYFVSPLFLAACHKAQGGFNQSGNFKVLYFFECNHLTTEHLDCFELFNCHISLLFLWGPVKEIASSIEDTNGVCNVF